MTTRPGDRGRGPSDRIRLNGPCNPGENKFDYTYDAQNQLTDDTNNTYAYDAGGNRTTDTTYVKNPDNVHYTNEINDDGTWDYTYDNEGNITEKDMIGSSEHWTYGYDNHNQLTDAKHYDGTNALVLEATYEYDVFGNRVEKDVTVGVTTTTTKFAVDGWNPAKPTPVGNENFDVWADLTAGGSLATRYLRGDTVDQLLGRVDDVSSTMTPYWHLADHLGSVRDILDGDGNVVDSLRYDSFGNIDTGSELDAAYRGRYAWTGREYDVETGLQYNRARYYDSTTGSWISQDPMGFDAGDSNLYRYVSNRVTTAVDPSGQDYIQVNVSTRIFGPDNDYKLNVDVKSYKKDGELLFKSTASDTLRYSRGGTISLSPSALAFIVKNLPAIGPDLVLTRKIEGTVITFGSPTNEKIAVDKKTGFEVTQTFEAYASGKISIKLNAATLNILKDATKSASDKQKALADYTKQESDAGREIFTWESTPVSKGKIIVSQVPGKWRLLVTSDYGKYDSEWKDVAAQSGKVKRAQTWLDNLKPEAWGGGEQMRRFSVIYGQFLDVTFDKTKDYPP